MKSLAHSYDCDGKDCSTKIDKQYFSTRKYWYCTRKECDFDLCDLCAQKLNFSTVS